MSQELDFSTPMMQQYMQLKQQYADCLLWFRLGDFYEMFLEHAKIGSEVLGITLTSRSRGKDGRIPMAGIPYHAADAYLAKLVQAGYKVAICEQMSEPDGRSLVDREVIRIVTPGTLLDEKALQHKENNYILSLYIELPHIGVAVADVSTGEFRVGEVIMQPDQSLEQCIGELILQFSPAECVLAPNTEANTVEVSETSSSQKQVPQTQLYKTLSKYPQLHLSQHPDWGHWVARFPHHLKQLKKKHHELTHLFDSSVTQVAAGALLGYIEHTQRTPATHLQTFQPLFDDECMRLDRSTVLNLELFSTLYDQQSQGSLLQCIDYTTTAMGGRLLKQWVHKPLYNQLKIEQRFSSVKLLSQHQLLRHELIESLCQLPDIERLLARLSVKLGTPRDVKNLALALETVQKIFHQLLSLELSPSALPLCERVTPELLTALSKLTKLIQTTMIDQPPVDPKSGGFIKANQDAHLDELRHIVKHSRDWILNLEASERQKTGISTLKIKFNQVFGFYIEVSNANLHLVPSSYTRKQTLVNAERFTTPELKHHEEIILGAEAEMNTIEYQLFLELVSQILNQVVPIQQAAHVVAELDCICGFAELAEQHHFTQPQLNQEGRIIIKQGRHPVVEQLVEHHQFVPNDVELGTPQHHLLLLTGPNMAGKSVLMRQVAIITLLAHVGSFVPAEAADIALTDQIFVRSGAADMITAGLSTFMVEMVETANILNHATEHSLIIMDEIGRGTSTYDGISIAWAVAEYLAQLPKSPKTLFATHYHELQQLAENYPQKIQNYHMSVTNHQGKPIFLYTLQAGGSSHSFGVAVAQLAGVPQPVIQRAEQVLAELEQRNSELTHTHPQTSSKPRAKQFTSTVPHYQDQTSQHIYDELKKLDINHLTPVSALKLIDQWQTLLTHPS